MHTASWLGIIFFGSELALALFKRAKSGGGDEMDRGSLKLLWLVITTSIFLAFACEFWLPQVRWPWQPWLNVMGIAIVMGGLALRWYSISYLGRFFTVNVAIAADHRLIDSGPYRWLRHPSYSGALLAFLGLGLCMRNWASLAILLSGTTAAFLSRIRIEESALTGAFGERYRKYMQHTARLIPGVY